MDNVLTAATVIIPVVMALTALAKQLIAENKYLPLLNVGIGLVIGIAWALSFGNPVVLYAWAGAIAGLSAGGFYDLGKGFLKEEK